MFGVARATVQQAVRMLESEGLVTARRGRGGGTFVTGPASDSVSRHRLIAHVSRNRRPIEEAVTYRLQIEPAAAGEAPPGRTADDLAGLRQIAGRAARSEEHTAGLQSQSKLVCR